MRPASTRVASSWLRSRLRDASPRQARDRGLFDVHEDDDEDDEPFDLFKRQPQSEAPEKPKAPEKPRAPKAPSKPKPESGPAEGDMRNDPLFDEFVGEKYQGGDARVPNPKPEARERYPEVTFSTAMKDGGFRRKVHEEFERWKGEQKDKKPSAPKEHGRLEIGQTIKDVSQLRVGDFIQSSRPGAPIRRIVHIQDGFVHMAVIDDDGNSEAVSKYPAGEITSGRHKRVEDPSTPAKPQADDGKEHKRLEVGETLKHVNQLRVGDVLQSSHADHLPKRRITRIADGYVYLREVDEDGFVGEEKKMADRAIVGTYKRVDDPYSPEKRREREEKRQRAEEEERKKQEKARRRIDLSHAKRRKKSPAWAKKQDELLDMIRADDVVDERRIGGEHNVNQTYKRRLRVGNAEADFVWKPASGEHPGNYGPLRTGIKAGTYHQREAACYNIDRLLGEGTVTPPTATTGDGSYQAFQDGARTFLDLLEESDDDESEGGVYEGIPRLSSNDLKQHPDFNRMNVLDLITGHEDRHIGNIMFVQDKNAPEGLRFIAIDNGLALASTEDKSDEESYRLRSPWKAIFGYVTEAVYDSTHNIDRKLHAKVKKIDHKEFVESMIDTGIDDESALVAALVRLSAIQRNPKILGKLDEDSHSEVMDSIKRFLYLAGARPEFLLQQAGKGPSFEELREVVRSALR